MDEDDYMWWVTPAGDLIASRSDEAKEDCRPVEICWVQGASYEVSALQVHLWWTTPDGQSDLPSGEYTTIAAAKAAIGSVVDEFAQEGIECQDGSWGYSILRDETCAPVMRGGFQP